MRDPSDVLLVTTSVASRAEADAMARALVEARLVACVQIVPIDSVYRWNETVETASECLLLVKIRKADFAEVDAAIRRDHAYDLPEIVAVPIVAGSTAYLDWIGAATAR